MGKIGFRILLLFFLVGIINFSCTKSEVEENIPQVTEYILSVSTTNGGTTSILGGTYEEGTQVTIIAIPNDGFFFAGWSNGQSETEITITMSSNISITAIFSSYHVIEGDSGKNLYLDLSMAQELIDSNVFEIIYDSDNRLFISNTSCEGCSLENYKFIRWEGDLISYHNPFIIEPDNQVLKLIIDDMYAFLDENYDMPFIYDWNKQINLTQNKPIGWEGKMMDYESNNHPDLFAITETSFPEKAISVVEFDKVSRSYALNHQFDVTSYFNIQEEDSLNTSSQVAGDFNDDGIMDFFINLHGEFISETWGENIFKSGPMVALISNAIADYTPIMVDEQDYLRFPGSCQKVDWNGDGYLDVFCSLPFELYINDGNNGFEKNTLNISPTLDWLSIRFADLNNDGFTDIIGANFQMVADSGIEIFYGTSNQNEFIYEAVPHHGWNGLWNGSDDLTIVDLDNDGFKEILIYNMNELHLETGFNYDTSEVREYKSTGAGYNVNNNSEYNLLIRSTAGQGSNSSTAYDFDNDGDKDIFIQWHHDSSTVNFTSNIPINTIYYFEQIQAENIPNEIIPSGFFWENINGDLVKKYFTELYVTN